MHSLTLSEEAQQENSFEDVFGFAEIELTAPPYAINFQLSLPDGDQGEGIESLTSGAIVVPITLDASSTTTCQTSTVYAVVHNFPAKITVKSHSITLGLARH